MTLSRFLARLAITSMLVAGAVIPAGAVTIDWVTVGDPGNAADTTGFGAVADSFQIMKYEWTNSQYVDFLNAIDPSGTNPNSIYSLSMGSDARGGITNTGTTDGSRYAAKANMGNKPVNFVSWWDAARVANWLQNAQGSGSTETGAYTLNNATTGTAPAVNSGARFYIPTEDQWYKAAYFKGGSANAGYWAYGTQSDTAPTTVTSGPTGIGSAGSTGNFANYNRTADWNSQDGNVTTVGTNGGGSAYGLYDMSGNVQEWNDLTGAAGSTRGLRGGSFNATGTFSESSSNRNPTTNFSNELNTAGFRLASPVAVPEPSTYALALAGVACGAWQLRRRKAKAA